VSAALRHLVAEFHGVPPGQLADGRLIGGLLVAAAGATGFGATEVPQLRAGPDGGVTSMLVLGGCHLIAHAFVDRELLLLDVLAPAARDSQKALDVFARRLTAREVRSEVHERG
jgi:S-adenosylmethionine decarboxylase